MRTRSLLLCVVVCALALFAPVRSYANEDADALYARGNAVGQAGLYAAAIGLIRQAAEKGHTQAEFALGSMLSNGQGAPMSKEQARIWFERAAAKGHPVALFNLGIYYDHGLGVKADRIRAIEYYKRAAKAGHAEAAFNAGQMLMMGVDMPVDEKEGMSYIAMAAKGGVATALLTMGNAHEHGRGGMSRDAGLALEYYARAEKAEIQYAWEGRTRVSRKVTEEGVALERDKQGQEALRFYDLACRFGEYHGCYNAANLRYSGRLGVTKDIARALPDYRTACSWAVEGGCRGVSAVVLSGGPVTAKDVDTARRYLNGECGRGHGVMCFNLAWIKTQPRFGAVDQKGAMSLLGQACLKYNYKPACQPYYNLYNALLPQQAPSRPASARREETFVESAILAGMTAITATLVALGSAGAASKGTYSGYSSYGAQSYAMTRPSPGGVHPAQDRADFRQFISSVSSYGSSVRCRPGNPYC
ncbi:MAG: tetratricopeptide repeat protein [Beijerinckiaceae bacterium]